MTRDLYLVDASIYVFRAYFSIPSTLTDSQGHPANALHGFADFVARFLSQARPSHVAIAFDESLTSSFRNELYADYKANRELPPADLERQLKCCRELSEQAGLAALSSDYYEADDLIGTLAALGRAGGYRIRILSGDKDLAQLLKGDDELWDFARGRRHGVADIPAWLGVEAHQVADYLAITGDAVDNIPGVPGIGPKGASALLHHFGSLETVYGRIDEVADLPLRGARRLQRLLKEHEAQVRLARRLTGIVEDAELNASLEDLRCRTVAAEPLLTWCQTSGIGRAVAGRLVQALTENNTRKR